MKPIPNKYKKHMALVLFGFKTQEELDEELTRYDIKDIEQLKKDILESFKKNKKSKSYLISLISRNEALKLPNKIINSPEDLIDLEEFIKSNPHTIEIWKFQKESNGIIGRFSINADGEQIVEQIWSSNHRKLENYDFNNGIPLIRATRERWYSRYLIDSVTNIPTSSKEQYIQLFFAALQEIERNREKIELMQKVFLQYGVNELSLEYRLDYRGFSFIDWDSSHDMKVLANLFSDNKSKGTENNER